MTATDYILQANTLFQQAMTALDAIPANANGGINKQLTGPVIATLQKAADAAKQTTSVEHTTGDRVLADSIEANCYAYMAVFTRTMDDAQTFAENSLAALDDIGPEDQPADDIVVYANFLRSKMAPIANAAATPDGLNPTWGNGTLYLQWPPAPATAGSGGGLGWLVAIGAAVAAKLLWFS